MAEDYVRPPLVALETSSRQVSIWRFRITLIVVLIAIAFGILLVVKVLIDHSENGNAQAGPRPLAAVTSVRR